MVQITFLLFAVITSVMAYTIKAQTIENSRKFIAARGRRTDLHNIEETNQLADDDEESFSRIRRAELVSSDFNNGDNNYESEGRSRVGTLLSDEHYRGKVVNESHFG